MWHDISDAPVTRAAPYGIMGIINATPDSFYSPSRYPAVEMAVRRAGELLQDGADIIDIGAESTRPYAEAISWQKECDRLLPIVESIRSAWPHAILSVDTRNARTAEAALNMGASIINDVSACSHDPELLDVIAEHRPGYVLMHARGTPQDMQRDPAYNDVMAEITLFFTNHLEKLREAGLPANRIVLDPGLGFGKTPKHNLAILRNMGQFLELGQPLLAGISMKSLFGSLWNLEPENRTEATSVVAALLFVKGCVWHRVHNVKATKTALQIACDVHKTPNSSSENN